MNKEIKRIAIVLLAQYFFYRFYFNFVSTAIQQLVLFGLLGIYLLFHKDYMLSYLKKLGRFKKTFIISCLGYTTIIAAAFFVPLAYKTYDFSYLITLLRNFSYMLSYLVLMNLIKDHMKPKNLKDEFIAVFIAASRNYVIVTLIMIVYPEIRLFWQSIIVESASNLELVNTHAAYIGRFGWAGYSGFSITFLVSVAVACSLYLMSKKVKNGEKLNKGLFFTLLLLLIGNSFYGRVGLFNSLSLIVIAGAYIIFKTKKYHYIWILVTSFMLFFGIVTFLKEYIAQLETWYDWVMDPIVNLLTTGELNTTSTDSLIDMYFLPSWKTMFFGDGFYTSPTGNSYYMSVDIGYLRPLLFYGSGMMAVNYIVPVSLFGGMATHKKDNILLAIMLIFTLFLFEVKGEVFMSMLSIAVPLFLADMSPESSNTSKKHLKEKSGLNNHFYFKSAQTT